jgi:hypothetical protein
VLKIKVNIEFTTTKSWGDVSTALDMLDPEDITMTTSTINNKVKRGYYKKKDKVEQTGHDEADKVTLKKLKRLSRPKHYIDQRIVWNSFEGNINVVASLKMLGMTRQQLADMKTKTGTAEYIVKQAAGRQNL